MRNTPQASWVKMTHLWQWFSSSNYHELLLNFRERIERGNVIYMNDYIRKKAVLTIDDSPYGRSRSKWVELLARVWDHSAGRFLKGFRMLTICWPDWNSCLSMDFVLLSSSEVEKCSCESQNALDKIRCAYQRRKEATEKSTAHLGGGKAYSLNECICQVPADGQLVHHAGNCLYWKTWKEIRYKLQVSVQASNYS